MAGNRQMPALPKGSSLKTGDSEVAEQAVEISIPSGPIQVRALAKGFYRKQRIAEGQAFTVTSFQELGSWMRCVNPVHRAAHERAMADRKKQLKNPAGQ